MQVVYICATLYKISTGTPASRSPSVTAGLLVNNDYYVVHKGVHPICINICFDIHTYTHTCIYEGGLQFVITEKTAGCYFVNKHCVSCWWTLQILIVLVISIK